MQLNIQNIDQIADANLIKPEKQLLQLPEKVLQFGTGVLLRGLPDYYIDKANRNNVFNGRVVVVKSTSSGGTDAFAEQNGLYTVCIRGIENGNIVEENIINSSISRVVNAATEWNQILDVAANEDIQIIISNTTEAGIQESDDAISDNPPKSFPGKVLAVLAKRFETCNGNADKGFVILPTELISNNGATLKKIVLNLARKNQLSDACIEWIDKANYFCNTLVDRIVPGAYQNEDLRYDDKLMIMAEPFGLWAIESNSEKVKAILSFANIDKGIVITPSIEKFKEIKLRLLNGSHTLTCALSILAKFDIVKASMANGTFHELIKALLLNEIGGAIQSESITEQDIHAFSMSVLDRFSNPFLEHKWTAIATNYTEKFKLRCVPILQKWYAKFQTIPEIYALGFAAFLQLSVSDTDISDKGQEALRGIWKSEQNPVDAILSREDLWGENLLQYKGLKEKIAHYINELSQQPTHQVMETTLDVLQYDYKMKNKVVQIAPKDNVLVALQDLHIGEEIKFNNESYLIQEDIPAKHKFFMQDMQTGDEIFMYGVLVGKTQYFVPKGGLMNTSNTKHAAEPFHYRPSHYEWKAPDVSKFKGRTFNGYVREDGRVGTANYWLFIPMVFCENRNLDIIKEALYNELGYAVSEKYKSYTHQLVKAYTEQQPLSSVDTIDLSPTIEHKSQRVFKNVDGIKFLNHQGGCGGTRQDAAILGKLLAAYSDNPNVAGITVLSLGCQNLQVADFKEYLFQRNPNFNKPLYIFEQQTSKSEEQLIKEAIRSTFEGLVEINKIERQPATLDKLVIGVKCGGSDGFSGISANPAVGYTSDLVTALGGKILLAEFPELCGAEQQLIDRTIDKDAAEKFIHLMRAYNQAAENVGSGFYMNPSPGNIKDGLITDAIKSNGAAKKGGSSPVVDVLDYTEPAVKPGLNLICTPGNDVEATTGKTASGATLILFTTGLGTPTGNPICPVIKVSTNNALAQRMSDIIDINTGAVIDGDKTIEQMGEDILEYCIKAASGEVIPKAVLLNQDDFIPWKRGVSL